MAINFPSFAKKSLSTALRISNPVASTTFNTLKSGYNLFSKLRDQGQLAAGSKVPSATPLKTIASGSVSSMLRSVNPVAGSVYDALKKPVAQAANQAVSTLRTPTPMVVSPAVKVTDSGIAPGPMSTASGASSQPSAIASGGGASSGGMLPRTGSATYSDPSFTSYDPRVQAKIAEMQRQAINSSIAQRLPSQPAATPASQGMNSSAGAIQPAALNPATALRAQSPSALDEARQRLLSLFGPSAEERTLQDELTTFNENARLGISNIEGQGRGIPLALVRGQQAKLGDQAEIKSQTIIQRLAAAQAARQAEQQMAAQQYGFAQEDRNFEAQQAQQAQNFQLQMLSAGYQPVDPSTVSDPNSVITIGGTTYLKPSPESKIFEVGGNLVNERGEVIYQGPTSGGEGFSLSPGQTRYDAYGNVIATAPGTTGAANATEGERASLGFYNRALAAEKNLQKIGSIQNLMLQQMLPNQLKSQEYQLFRQAGEDFIKAVLRAESGASIPPDEMESYFKTYFPQPGDSQAVIDQKAASRQQQIQSLQIEAGRAYQDDPLGLGFNNVGAGTNSGVMDYDHWIDSTGNSRITQGFNTPVTYMSGRHIHGGLDIDGKIGDPVSTPISGTVVTAQNVSGWGNTVVIRDAQGNMWRFAHLDRINVRPGQTVGTNSYIGTLGNTGTVFKTGGGDGSHLHFEVKDSQGRLVDPLRILG